MKKSDLKLLFDRYGMLYYQYLKYREKFLPTKFQKLEKQRHIERLKFYSNFIHTNDVVFDIGANYGNRTKVFLELGAKVIAVEPQKHCLKYLDKMFGNKIHIIPKAISDSPGRAQLHFSSLDTASISATLDETWIKDTVSSQRFTSKMWDKKIEVETITLDLLIQEYGKPKFCKIDIEGFELLALKGLTSIIENISFEFTTPERKKDLISCLLELKKLGSKQSYLFNYCIGENSEYNLKEWIKMEDLLLEIKENKLFTQSGVYGDIYAKSINP